MTPHISAEKGDFAPTVLMPGDPKRSHFIAETFFTDAVLVNDVRGVQGYTGFYNDKSVSVMASGMGMPSMGIYSYELFNFYGVENIIRVGSAGSLQPSLPIGSTLLASAAATDSVFIEKCGFSKGYLPAASEELLRKARAAASTLGIAVTEGTVFSSDVFYDGGKQNAALASRGVLAVEMEAAALYANAENAGKNALCLCTVSDDLVHGGGLSHDQRRTSLISMIRIALEIA